MTDSHVQSYNLAVPDVNWNGIAMPGSLPAPAAEAYLEENLRIAILNGHYGDDLHADHIVNSQSAILRTAIAGYNQSEPDQPREAIILGAGNSFDIPLKDIVNIFDLTTMVDVDMLSMQKAISGLTPDELGKVSLIGADITGIISDFTMALTGIGERAPCYAEFNDQAASKVDELRPANTTPDFGKRYAFVCSQLVMSQLCDIPLGYIEREVVGTNFGRTISSGPNAGNDRLRSSLDSFRREMQLGHLSFLSELVSQTGTIHFADTYLQISGDASHPDITTMVREGDVGPALKLHFREVGPAKGWKWTSSLTTEYLVIARALTPRKQPSYL